MLRYVLFFIVIVNVCFGNDEVVLNTKKQANSTERQGRDSYLDAYHESHGGSTHFPQKNIDRESKYSSNFDGYVSNHYGPPNGYPEAHHPPPSYGPPVYGPPHVPSYPEHFPLHQMPHAMLGILDKFHLKLDIFTVLKILLKLVLFKKLVSFIALICLLLFIPKFKMDKEEADDPDARKIKNLKHEENERLNNIHNYVLNAIEKFSGRSEKCTGILCTMEEISQNLDNKYSYSRLWNMYTSEKQ